MTADQDQGQAEAVDPATGMLSPEVRRELARQLAPDLGPALAQQAREDKAAAEHAKATAHTCAICGVGVSWRAGKAWWFHDQHGPVCSACDLDRRSFQRPNGTILADSEHRARIVAELIGPELARFQWPPFLVARAPELLRWWHELPPAEQAAAPAGERFGWVDREALVASLKAKPPPPPELVRWRKCPKCKARDRWQVIERPVSGQAYLTGDGITRPYVEVRRVCHGDGGRCRYEPEPQQRYS
jgi:hypothetical protein